MTETLRGALGWKRVRTGAALVLTLAVGAFVVIPAVGLVLAFLALSAIAIAQIARRKEETKK
jgi:hypothetical protein